MEAMNDLIVLLDAISVAEPLGMGEVVQRVWNYFRGQDPEELIERYKQAVNLWSVLGEPEPGMLYKAELVLLALSIICEAKKKYEDEGRASLVI
jgi:hypothetical protein